MTIDASEFYVQRRTRCVAWRRILKQVAQHLGKVCPVERHLHIAAMCGSMVTRIPNGVRDSVATSERTSGASEV